jgi:hypothetical protein
MNQAEYDEEAVRKYLADADPRFVACRADGRHTPVRVNHRWRDVRPDHRTGGWIIHTHCEHCEQAMSRPVGPDGKIRGPWKVHYEKGYLAKPGEGSGLTSKDGRAVFRLADLGLLDATPPATVTPIKKTASKGRGRRA